MATHAWGGVCSADKAPGQLPGSCGHYSRASEGSGSTAGTAGAFLLHAVLLDSNCRPRPSTGSSLAGLEQVFRRMSALLFLGDVLCTLMKVPPSIMYYDEINWTGTPKNKKLRFQ